MDRNGEKKGSKDADLRRFNEIFRSWDNWLVVEQPADPIVLNFPRLSHTPPSRNPSGLSRRERILALYRQQGRPQAHIDRVMRLGRV